MSDYKTVLKRTLSESNVFGCKTKTRLNESAENEIDEVPGDDDPGKIMDQVEDELLEAYRILKEEADDLVVDGDEKLEKKTDEDEVESECSKG